jgi:hypothetical protein
MTDRNKGQLPLPLPRPNLNALKFPGRQRDPKPYFEAGQRVVCVDASPNRLASNRKLLIASKIYVIRAIDLGFWKWPWSGVHLDGIRIFYPCNDAVERASHPARFRNGDRYRDFQEAVGRASSGERRRGQIGADLRPEGRTADRGHEPESVAFLPTEARICSSNAASNAWRLR